LLAGVRVVEVAMFAPNGVGMRPGSLARRGLGYEDLLAQELRLVFATISGRGQSGPYLDRVSHGLAFAGLSAPREVDDARTRPHACRVLRQQGVA
jgi:crotonobetainyl-CoA:carnitine CoA-transferase CaiB-like acyl-CoA transferase